MRLLFEAVASPLADARTAGAFYREWRLMSLDGTCLDVADTAANEREFGRPGSSGREGGGAFPQVRLVALSETGTHAICSARLGPLSSSEKPDQRAHRDGQQVRVVEYQLDDGARSDPEQRYRLLSTILEPEQAPAAELGPLYHERWELEGTLDELKVHQRGPRVVLRSKAPEQVYQEAYGYLCTHYAIRRLMHDAALRADLDPDRLSFTRSLRAARRSTRTHPGFFFPTPHDQQRA